MMNKPHEFIIDGGVLAPVDVGSSHLRGCRGMYPRSMSVRRPMEKDGHRELGWPVYEETSVRSTLCP